MNEHSGFDLLISGGQLVLPDGTQPGSVGVRDGLIAALLPVDVTADRQQVVDASGLTILPGLFDMHVHFREPGNTHKETFETGTAAAAVGGFTSVADMPNTVPPTTTAERLIAKRDLAGAAAHVDFALWGGAGSLQRVEELVKAGCCGIKVYLGLETAAGAHSDAPGELVVNDDAQLVEILEAAARADIVVAVHCGNEALRAQTRNRWRGKGFAELRSEVANEPQAHKVETVSLVLLLAGATGARVHIAHVPAPALPLIRAAKERGLPVTAEAALPFVTLDLIDHFAELGFDRYRSVEDAEALWAAARDGTVDVLATDHAPHTFEEKRAGRDDLLAAPSGYPELDTALPMLLDAVHRGILTLERLAALMGSEPARVLGMSQKGSLRVGADADMVLVDLTREGVVERDRLQTKAGWSPFEGRRVVGWPVRTYLRGQEIATDGRLVGMPGGKFLSGGSFDA